MEVGCALPWLCPGIPLQSKHRALPAQPPAAPPQSQEKQTLTPTLHEERLTRSVKSSLQGHGKTQGLTSCQGFSNPKCSSLHRIKSTHANSHLPLLPLATTLPWNYHILLPSPGISLPLFSHTQAWPSLLPAQPCLPRMPPPLHPMLSVPSSRFSSPALFRIVSLDQSSVPKHFPPPSPLCALSANRS